MFWWMERPQDTQYKKGGYDRKSFSNRHAPNYTTYALSLCLYQAWYYFLHNVVPPCIITLQKPRSKLKITTNISSQNEHPHHVLHENSGCWCIQAANAKCKCLGWVWKKGAEWSHWQHSRRARVGPVLWSIWNRENKIVTCVALSSS
jgi:hypothetical protein